MDWDIPYIIRKLLEHRCLKWAHMTHLDTSNTSYDIKKGRKSNWQFDSQALKVGNRPNFLACKWCVTHYWKFLDEVYNFALDLISIEGLHTKSWAPKSREFQLWGLGSTLGSLGTKCHLSASPVTGHRVYYKGEGGGFPQIRAVLSLVSLNLPVARPSTKTMY